METTKRIWKSPVNGVQEFVPNNYCAPCGDGETTVTYYFTCDAGTPNRYHNAFLDSNGNGQLDGHYETEGSGIFEHDVWVWDDQRLTRTYHPCNETHEVTVAAGTSVDDIFLYGFITPNGQTSPVTTVRIWRGDNNDNVHCTTNLRSESFTPHNPS